MDLDARESACLLGGSGITCVLAAFEAKTTSILVSLLLLIDQRRDIYVLVDVFVFIP